MRMCPGEAPDSWAGHCCSCYFALYFLQSMIEVCPGGAVDAIMLGESFLFFFLASLSGLQDLGSLTRD